MECRCPNKYVVHFACGSKKKGLMSSTLSASGPPTADGRRRDSFPGLRLSRGQTMKTAIYARVSTFDQEPENQLQELRRYVAARGWTAVEYVDRGVSGAKDRRPALDQLLIDAKRRRFDVLICWRLDRLGRSLKHLITRLDELQALGVAFVSLAEGIDATTAAGKLQMHILAAIAEFERARIVERVRAGLARRAAQGKPLGRPRQAITQADLARTVGFSTRKAAALLGVSHAAVHRARAVSKTSPIDITNCA